MFEIRNLMFKTILDIKELTIDQQITCIVGSSGSGKTTLLKLLNALYRPDQGEIRYRGEDITSIDAVALRRKIVMLNQTPVIYPGTVRDNLIIGLEFSNKEIPDDSTLQLYLQRVSLDKGLGETCHTLSGGEKQRLCLARVMALQAEVYLLDEPSAALDQDTEQFVIDNMVKFVRDEGKTLIMVTHSQSIAHQFKENCVYLIAGKVAEKHD